MRFPTQWETVNADTDRLFVKGGWLVRVFRMAGFEREVVAAVCFLPDPNHEWEVKS